MSAPDEPVRPRRRTDVEAVDVDRELVLWDPSGRTVYRLDPVGSLFWPFLDGGATLTELAADAAEVWAVPEQTALDALVALVGQLEEASLLEDGHSRSAPPRPTYLVDPPSP